MKIEDLKYVNFETGSIKVEDFYMILEHFDLLDKLDLIKAKYKDNSLRDLIDFDELTSKGYELEWDGASRTICNLSNVLTREQAADLILNAGSTFELEKEIFAIYLETALKKVAQILIEDE